MFPSGLASHRFPANEPETIGTRAEAPAWGQPDQFDLRIENNGDGVLVVHDGPGAPPEVPGELVPWRKADKKKTAEPAEPVATPLPGAAKAEAPALSRRAVRWLEALGKEGMWCEPGHAPALARALALRLLSHCPGAMPPYAHVCLTLQPEQGRYGAKVVFSSEPEGGDPARGWVWSRDPGNGFFDALSGALDRWTRGVVTSTPGAHSPRLAHELRRRTADALRASPEFCDSCASLFPLTRQNRPPRAETRGRGLQRPQGGQPATRPFSVPAIGRVSGWVSPAAGRWLTLFQRPDVTCRPEHRRALGHGIASLALQARSIRHVEVLFHDATLPGSDKVVVPPGVSRVLVVGFADRDGRAWAFAMPRQRKDIGPEIPSLFPANLEGIVEGVAGALRRIEGLARLQAADNPCDARSLHAQLLAMLARNPDELERLAREAPLHAPETTRRRADVRQGGLGEPNFAPRAAVREREVAGWSSGSDSSSASDSDSEGDSDSDLETRSDSGSEPVIRWNKGGDLGTSSESDTGSDSDSDTDSDTDTDTDSDSDSDSDV